MFGKLVAYNFKKNFNFINANRGYGLEKFVLVFDPTEHTSPAGAQPRTHGKTRAGVVCFNLEPKTHFANLTALYHF